MMYSIYLHMYYENDRFVEIAGLSFEGTDHGYLVFTVTPAEDGSLHFEVK
ncbi:MAG: hypothetical protein K6G90_10320 [Clostridia bacterium]|nr:hypothetical protein [Clostridia bacterium]